MIRILVCCCVCVAVLISCSQVHTPSTRRTTDYSPAGHWVQEQRVRHLMSALGTETVLHWPDLPPEALTDSSPTAEYEMAKALKQQTALREACTYSLSLAQAAMDLPAAVSKTPMPHEDRLAFNALSRQLYHQAVQLDQFAGDGDLAAMQGALDQIRTTCNHCHQQFRSYAGELSSDGEPWD